MWTVAGGILLALLILAVLGIIIGLLSDYDIREKLLNWGSVAVLILFVLWMAGVFR